MRLKIADDCFHSQEHHKGLSYCKTPEIFDHPLTSPPSPKRGPGLFCPRTSILLLGVWVQLHGLSAWRVEHVCQGNNIRQDCARGPWGNLEFTVKAGQLVGICHMWRYGSLQVRWGHWTSTSKCRCWKIRCPHGCSYQDRALIYCKQRVIPVP